MNNISVKYMPYLRALFIYILWFFIIYCSSIFFENHNLSFIKNYIVNNFGVNTYKITYYIFINIFIIIDIFIILLIFNLFVIYRLSFSTIKLSILFNKLDNKNNNSIHNNDEFFKYCKKYTLENYDVFAIFFCIESSLIPNKNQHKYKEIIDNLNFIPYILKPIFIYSNLLKKFTSNTPANKSDIDYVRHLFRKNTKSKSFSYYILKILFINIFTEFEKKLLYSSAGLLICNVIKHNIHKEYIKPFIKEIEDSKINEMNFIIGLCYYCGRIVERDYHKAYMAFSDFERIDRNNLAESYYRNNLAESYLGNMSLLGRGTVEDVNKAIYWFEKSIKNGNAKAAGILALIYDTGYEVEKNIDKAITLYSQGADRGDAFSQKRLAIMYEYGMHVDENVDKAVKLYEAAANQKDMEAQFRLGVLYQKGIKVENNPDEAFKWLKRAADFNEPKIVRYFAKSLEKGIGIEKNEELAKIYYEKYNEINTDNSGS